MSSNMETLPTAAVQTTKQLLLENPTIKSCKECWVEFNTIEDWKFHMVDVHGVKVVTLARGKTTSSNRRCEECWVEFASLKDFMYHMLDVHNKDITKNSKTLSLNKKTSSLLRDYRWNRRKKVVFQNQSKKQFCTKCGHCFIDEHEDEQCKVLLQLMQSCVVVLKDISRLQETAESPSPPESLEVLTPSSDSEEDFDFTISEDQQPTENEAESLLCDCCGTPFNSLTELKTHLAMSLCVHCGTSFNTSKELEQHVATSECGRSGASFDNSSELQQRRETSLCNQCGVSFKCLEELEEHLSTSLCISVKQEPKAEADDFADDFQNKLLEREIKVEPCSESEVLQEQLQNEFFERELKSEPLELKNNQEQALVNLFEGEIKVEAAEPENVQSEELQNYSYESDIKQEPLESENMQEQLQNYSYESEIKQEPLESENMQGRLQFVLHSEITIEQENFDGKMQLEPENFDGKMQLEPENFDGKMQLESENFDGKIQLNHIKIEPESEDDDNQMFPRPLQIELDHEMKTKVLEKAIKTEPVDTVEEMQTSLFEHPLRIELEGIQAEMQEEVLENLIKTEPNGTEEHVETNVDQQSFEEQNTKDQEIQANFLSRPIKSEPVSDDDEEKIEMYHQPLVIVSEKEEKKEDVVFNDGHLHEAVNLNNKKILAEEAEESISIEPPFKKQCTDVEPNQLIYFCFICLKNFNDGNEVYRHLLDEHKGSHRCKACHRFLPSTEFFVFHMLCHHKSTCLFCGKVFGSLRPLRLHEIEHIMQADPDSEWCKFLKPVFEAVKVQSSCYTCPFCKTQFTNLIRLVFHCSVHLRETKFSAMVSEFKSAFTSESSLLSASVDDSTEKPLICILNLNPVHPKKIKKRFRKKIASFPMIECSKCQEQFQTEKALSNHICFDSDFICQLCGISCTSSPAMYDHYLEHSKVGETIAKNRCNLCRIAFVEKTILCDHYLEHIRIGDKTCPYCNVGVTDLVMAAKHMKRHFGCGTRLRRCVQCERVFFNERNFYQHLCLDPREDVLIKELTNLKSKAKKRFRDLPVKTSVFHETVTLPKQKKVAFPNGITSQYVYCVPQAHYSNTNFGRLVVDLELSNKEGEKQNRTLMPSSSLTSRKFSSTVKRKLLPTTSPRQVSKNFHPGKQVMLVNAAYPNLIGDPPLAKEYQIAHSNTTTVSSTQSQTSAAKLPVQPEPLVLPSSLPSFAEPQLQEQEHQFMPQILKVESLSPLANCQSMVAVLPQFSSLPIHVMKSEISGLSFILPRQ